MKTSISHYLDYFGALLVKSGVRQGIRTYSEIGYLMCNFVNKMEGGKEKTPLWYSRGGMKRTGYTIGDGHF